MLGLRLDTTPDQLRYVVAEIPKLYEHPYVELGGRVRLIGSGTHSLNLEIFAYAASADLDAFLPIQEDLLFGFWNDLGCTN